MKVSFRMGFPLLILIVLGIIYVGILQYKIVSHANIDAQENADYLIILGARVKGKVPSLALQFRIDRAAEYLKENPGTLAIASGGQGPGEEISEAHCIKKELVDLGIEETRIIIEDKSTDTYENIRFSKQLIPSSAKTGLVVTNDFHIFRAKLIAQDEELKVNGLPAKTPVQAILKSYIREYLALSKYILKAIF
jgi:uncharacterized SAM-binding protein YcdF (DUF218 family)